MSGNAHKRRREAERRAQARRESLERKLRGELEQGARPLPAQTPLRSLADADAAPGRRTFRNGSPLPRVFANVALLLCVGVSAVGGAFAIIGATPVVSDAWNWAGLAWLLPALFAGILATRVASAASITAKVLAALSSVLVAVTLVLGAHGQIVVGGEAQLRGSVGDRSQRLASALLNDMLVLEGNQKLLNLPPEQARGVFGLYEEAAAQSQEIAARWNPVVAGDVPLPGFVQVLSKVNEAADLQARALLAYADDLQQPDPARYQEIVNMRDRTMALLSGPDGAAPLLGQTVAPLGIELDVADEGRHEPRTPNGDLQA